MQFVTIYIILIYKTVEVNRRFFLARNKGVIAVLMDNNGTQCNRLRLRENKFTFFFDVAALLRLILGNKSQLQRQDL